MSHILTKSWESPLVKCWALGLTLLAFAGCNSSDLVTVTGQVTLDGNPVPTGRIEFFPASGRPIVGEINGEGRYKLAPIAPKDGVSPGKYKVTVTSRSVTGGSSPPPGITAQTSSSDQSPKQPIKIEWNVPQRYSNKAASGLSAEVSKDAGDINFELVSQR